jgi:hypothetical protein
MPVEPFLTTVRFSVFVDPVDKRRALASLSESPVGASPWQAVDLRGIRRPLDWEYSKLLYILSKEGTDAEAREVGKNLYAVFFAEAIQQVFRSARSTAPRGKIRIAIDSCQELCDIPWELLHDDHDFLLRQDCSIIRVARELPPGVAYFGPLTRVAVVAVTPDFDARGHVDGLAAKLKTLGVEAVTCRDPNRRELMDFLDREPVDALYFLGHGRAGQVLLKPDRGDSGWLDAGDLAQWLPDPAEPRRPRVNLVYFSSCGTAERRPEEHVFSGVAQRLMLSGRAGSVLAMQAKIGVTEAFRLAESFFEGVVRGGDPEAALLRARTVVSNIWARSIPVLYTHVDGPKEFRKNRLARLLGMKPGDGVGVSLAALRMGVKQPDYDKLKEQLLKAVEGVFYYRGRTYGQGDVHAVKELLDLLTQVGDLSRVIITGDDELPDCPVAFFFGSHSHQRVESLVHEYARQFDLQTGDQHWAVVDRDYQRRYEIPAPTRQDVNYYDQDDWGIIEKAVGGGRCYFFVCGLGDRATRGCAYFLARRWEELLAQHQDRPFAALLRFPGRVGEDYTRGELVDRAQNTFGVPIEASGSSLPGPIPSA